MTLKAMAATIALAVALASPAYAKHRMPRHDSQAASRCLYDNSGHMTCREWEYRTHARRIASDANGNRADPRPRAWCGWFLRHHFGVADRALNRALAWLHWGSRASGPAVGVVVVWSHGHGAGHVGVITAKTAGGWKVLSGNDGHAVRDRVRNVRNAVGFRWPPQRLAMQ